MADHIIDFFLDEEVRISMREKAIERGKEFTPEDIMGQMVIDMGLSDEGPIGALDDDDVLPSEGFFDELLEMIGTSEEP